MKNVFLLLIILFATKAFAQNKAELKQLVPSSQEISKIRKDPTFMVNDSLVDKNIAIKLNLDLIQDIVIVKDDPKYPDGLIKIAYKTK